MKKRIVTYFIVGGAAVLGASPHLHDFLRKWEGVEYVAYADKLAGGVPTVCAGITNAVNPPRKVVVGERWTGEECKVAEEKIILEIQAQLAKCITHPVPQSTFEALTSHAWNLGWPNTCSSQSVRLINQGRIKEGCNLLSNKPDGRPNWSNSGGSFIQGLFNRRLSERELCLKDLSTD